MSVRWGCLVGSGSCPQTHAPCHAATAAFTRVPQGLPASLPDVMYLFPGEHAPTRGHGPVISNCLSLGRPPQVCRTSTGCPSLIQSPAPGSTSSSPSRRCPTSPPAVSHHAPRKGAGERWHVQLKHPPPALCPSWRRGLERPIVVGDAGRGRHGQQRVGAAAGRCRLWQHDQDRPRGVVYRLGQHAHGAAHRPHRQRPGPSAAIPTVGVRCVVRRARLAPRWG
jgi:hypothetical protein